MSKEGFCQHCGHAHPSSRGEGVVKCLHCGLPLDLTDKVQCPGCGNLSKRGTQFCAECGSALFKMCTGCTKRGPVDATFCAECGSALLDYQTYLARKKSEQEELDQQTRQATSRRALASVLIIAALLAGAWFFCILPLIGWVGQTGDGSVIRAVQMSQAQIQATQQAEIADRTRAFEDIVVELGPIVSREYVVGHGPISGEALDLYVVAEIVVRNEGDVPHRALLSYQITSYGSGTEYRNVNLPAHGELSFPVRVRIGDNIVSGDITNPYTTRNLVWISVVVEEVDDVLREYTTWKDRWQDWELSIADDAPLSEYVRVEK